MNQDGLGDLVLARKKFEEQFDQKKETYAQMTGRNDDKIQKEEEKELVATKIRQRNMNKLEKRRKN
jgi:hypothetical protein